MSGTVAGDLPTHCIAQRVQGIAKIQPSQPILSPDLYCQSVSMSLDVNCRPVIGLSLADLTHQRRSRKSSCRLIRDAFPFPDGLIDL